MIYTYVFDALQHAAPEDQAALFMLFKTLNISGKFPVVLLRRREFWAMTLPEGIFVNDPRPGIVSFADDVAARDALLLKLKTLRISVGRRSRIFIDHQGQLYCHQRALDVLRRHAEHPALLNAAYRFLEAARLNPASVKPSRVRPYVEPSLRRKLGNRAVRGPGWAPHEDLVLRQWFGIRTVGPDAGHHAVLSPDEWQLVLAQLQGRRSMASIRQRLTALNLALKHELSVDGYIPRDRLREYMLRVLGTRPRRPRVALKKPRRTRTARTAGKSASAPSPAAAPPASSPLSAG